MHLIIPWLAHLKWFWLYLECFQL